MKFNLTNTIMTAIVSVLFGIIICYGFFVFFNFGLKIKTDIHVYNEVLNNIKNNSLFINSDVNNDELFYQCVSNYLKKIDPYSAYLLPKDYATFKHLDKEDYVGVGMEIEKNTQGQYFCFPYPDSPAEKAGINKGDLLEKINGKNVSGKTLNEITYESKGKSGTILTVTVKKKTSLLTNQYKIVRQVIQTNHISINWNDNLPIIRIKSFTINTPIKLRQILYNIKDNPIIIDLRGNPGGNFYQAIEAAMIFLSEKKLIISVKSNKSIKDYKATTEAVNDITPIYIFQDEFTASAAEVFIAALTQNNRAESIGKKSFGKGVMQELIELKMGGALLLTTKFLLTPNGIQYHGKGLVPNYLLAHDEPQTKHYIQKLKMLLQKK